MTRESAQSTEPEFELLIIGSGFSGLGMAIELRKAGKTSFVVLERADEVGGTWRDNDYPGCACDVPSHLYSFSFEQNPDWSRSYSPQAEIWDYLLDCVEEYGLRKHLRFGWCVREAHFDEAAQLWRVKSEDGRTVSARYVVASSGPLAEPVIPQVPGLSTFEGTSFHSATWDHDFDLQGKTVAAVGTGASAIQFVPAIAPEVARLHLFQRTPAWVLPRNDRAMRPWQQKLFRRLPWVHRLVRWWTYFKMEYRALAFIKLPAAMKLFEGEAKAHIRKSISNPDLVEALTPKYRLGCKRILVSDDYYPALARDNVELVNSGLAEVRQQSVVSADGREFPVDAIIFGTGFRGSQPLFGIDIFGLGGRSLQEEWAEDGAEAYYGVAVSGYPNFFILHGPNSGVGHTSVIFMIEAQIAFVLRALSFGEERRSHFIHLKNAVQERFNQGIQARLQGTVWGTGCRSWYQNAAGKNIAIWPSFTFQFSNQCRSVPADVFEFSA